MEEYVPSFTTQGTRLSEKAPWETYSDSLETKISPKLEKEIQEYSQHRHVKTSFETEDEYYKQKEVNDELAKQYQWLRPEDYENFEARIGRIINHAELINKLRKAGLKCWYVEHPHPDKLTLLVQKKEYLGLEVGCWVTYGYMPELSIMRFDEHGVPINEKYRGYRTVLMQLLLHGMITEEKINKYFPVPRQDKEFKRYNNFMYDMRNTLAL